MQNVTGKTTIKKNSKKIVSDIFFFTSICGYPASSGFKRPDATLRRPGEATARRVVCGRLLWNIEGISFVRILTKFDSLFLQQPIPGVQIVEWNAKLESGEIMRKRGRGGAFLKPCSHLPAPSPQSENLKQATLRHTYQRSTRGAWVISYPDLPRPKNRVRSGFEIRAWADKQCMIICLWKNLSL